MFPLFRGCTKEGEWIEGCLLQTEIKEIFNNGLTKVLPHTISMYTGQTDKNGVKIFGSIPIDGVMTRGGDVVKHIAGDLWKVKYEFFEHDGYALQGFQCFCKSEWDKIEVIGNQTQHSKLL